MHTITQEAIRMWKIEGEGTLERLEKWCLWIATKNMYQSVQPFYDEAREFFNKMEK